MKRTIARTLASGLAAVLGAGTVALVGLGGPAGAAPRQDEEPIPPSECVDVPRDVYFTDAFDWAWDTGVTTGVGGTDVCEPLRELTRGEAITILWRAVGSPDEGEPHGFTDTIPGAFYEPALRWAKANDYTTGFAGDATSFEPEALVDRAQQFTFLWRIAGSEEGDPHPFVDVVPGSYYEEAVNWAATYGITTGYAGSDRFEPTTVIDRAQAFTIVYRAVMGEL